MGCAVTVKNKDASKCSNTQLSRHAKAWSLFQRLNLQPWNARVGSLGAACARVKPLSQNLKERDGCVMGRRARGSKANRRGTVGWRMVAGTAGDCEGLDCTQVPRLQPSGSRVFSKQRNKPRKVRLLKCSRL